MGSEYSGEKRQERLNHRADFVFRRYLTVSEPFPMTSPCRRPFEKSRLAVLTILFGYSLPSIR